jgi:Toprim-like
VTTSSRVPAVPTLAMLVPRDVYGALSALGIDADERGDEAIALCPNPDHDDTHASWSCNLDTGMHNCFSCSFSGSFTYLVTKMLGIPTPGAQAWVRERKIKDIADGFTGPQPRSSKPLPVVSETDLWKFTAPPPDALEDRRLTAVACEFYGVRWDAARDLWITPVREPYTGKLWGWQEKNARHFRNRPLDIPKSRSVFGFQSLARRGTAVVVESPLDVPYLWAAGIDGAVSGFGVSVSREQVRVICDRADEIVLALDNDRAGWHGVGKLAWSFGTNRVRAFNYGGYRDGPGLTTVDEDALDGRDPGDLTDDEIAWGIDHAVPVWKLSVPWL